MFEDSLMESAGQIPAKSKWTVAGSMVVQAFALLLLLFLPLLVPESLPPLAVVTALVAPPESRPPTAPSQAHPSSAPTHAGSNYPVIAALNVSSSPALIGRQVSLDQGSADPPAAGDWRGNIAQSGIADGMPRLAPAPPARVAERIKKGPVRISSGVAAGQLLSPIRPGYPAMAQAARVQGTIVVEATISAEGAIQDVHIIAGPMLLQEAAVRAIRAARYKPFLLNGQPVEVRTTINIVFTLGAA